ncbi:MAG: helix-turn-helix domain-containing protein [Thermoplasmata archaeon]|nr:helix-turn-helix domain-containing protein [Thermoplasmata archaeon]
MMEALLSLAMPCSWIYNLAKEHQVRVLLIDTVQADESITKDLVEINLREEDSDAVIEFIKDFEHVVNVEITERHKGRLLAIVEVRDCPGCVSLATSDVFLLSAHTTEDKRIEWKVAFSNREDLDKLIWDMQSTGSDVELVRVSNAIDDGLRLTDRQLKIVEVAFKRGYYDYPKRISIRELARIFGVSTATVSEILRRGQRKIIKEHFEGKKKI